MILDQIAWYRNYSSFSSRTLCPLRSLRLNHSDATVNDIIDFSHGLLPSASIILDNLQDFVVKYRRLKPIKSRAIFDADLGRITKQ